MFSRRENLAALKTELDSVNDEIARHPLKSEDTEAANKIIETGKKENKTTSEINSELVSKNLPSLEDGGRTLLNGLFGWSKLHRRRRKLEKKIQRIEKRAR